MLYPVMVPGKTRSIAMGYVSWDGVRSGARLGHPGARYSCRRWEEGQSTRLKAQRWDMGYCVKWPARNG